MTNWRDIGPVSRDTEVSERMTTCHFCNGNGWYFQGITKPMGGQLVTIPAFKDVCSVCKGSGVITVTELVGPTRKEHE